MPGRIENNLRIYAQKGHFLSTLRSKPETSIGKTPVFPGVAETFQDFPFGKSWISRALPEEVAKKSKKVQRAT